MSMPTAATCTAPAKTGSACAFTLYINVRSACIRRHSGRAIDMPNIFRCATPRRAESRRGGGVCGRIAAGRSIFPTPIRCRFRLFGIVVRCAIWLSFPVVPDRADSGSRRRLIGGAAIDNASILRRARRLCLFPKPTTFQIEAAGVAGGDCDHQPATDRNAGTVCSKRSSP